MSAFHLRFRKYSIYIVMYGISIVNDIEYVILTNNKAKTPPANPPL